MKTETYTLTSDVPNPSHDKRCKYGMRSKKFFKKGSLVTIRTGKLSEILSLEMDPAKDREVKHVWIDHQAIDHDIANNILAHCELLCEGKITIDQIFEMYDVPGNAIIRALITNGRVSIEDVHDTYKELQ